MILQKLTFQVSLKNVLLLQKLKLLFHGHMLLVLFKVKKLLECFKKTNQKEFQVEKVMKRKSDKLYDKTLT